MIKMIDNCNKYCKYGRDRLAKPDIKSEPIIMKTLSQEYGKDCDCIQCLKRRRTYLKMVIHNLKQHEGWEKAINRHQSEIGTIEEKLDG